MEVKIDSGAVQAYNLDSNGDGVLTRADASADVDVYTSRSALRDRDAALAKYIEKGGVVVTQAAVQQAIKDLNLDSNCDGVINKDDFERVKDQAAMSWRAYAGGYPANGTRGLAVLALQKVLEAGGSVKVEAAGTTKGCDAQKKLERVSGDLASAKKDLAELYARLASMSATEQVAKEALSELEAVIRAQSKTIEGTLDRAAEKQGIAKLVKQGAYDKLTSELSALKTSADDYQFALGKLEEFAARLKLATSALDMQKALQRGFDACAKPALDESERLQRAVKDLDAKATRLLSGKVTRVEARQAMAVRQDQIALLEKADKLTLAVLASGMSQRDLYKEHQRIRDAIDALQSGIRSIRAEYITVQTDWAP